jgi:hypothetical protein
MYHIPVTQTLIGCSEHDCNLHGGWSEESSGSSSKHYIRFDMKSCRRASAAAMGHENVNKQVKPARLNFLNAADKIRWDRVIVDLFDNAFFQISTFDNGRLMPLCRWSFASMLMQLEIWVNLYGVEHCVVAAIVRSAARENISLKTLHDCAEEIKKDYASRNSGCFIIDDVPVAQILQICSTMSTELCGVRELVIQSNTTIKAQQRELKEYKISQLETQSQLKHVGLNLIATQNLLQSLQNQINIMSKRKNTPIDMGNFMGSNKRSKAGGEKVAF